MSCLFKKNHRSRSLDLAHSSVDFGSCGPCGWWPVSSSEPVLSKHCTPVASSIWVVRYSWECSPEELECDFDQYFHGCGDTLTASRLKFPLADGYDRTFVQRGFWEIDPALSLALIGNTSARAGGLWRRQDGDGPRHFRKGDSCLSGCFR